MQFRDGDHANYRIRLSLKNTSRKMRILNCLKYRLNKYFLQPKCFSRSV